MRYLRRLVWFIATRLMIILFLLGTFTVTFYYAMNATNIYIIIKDGMARRAQVIMMDAPADPLKSYFSTAWLDRDTLLQGALAGNGPYANVKVTGFDHRITLKSVWCWPWSASANATVVERVPAIDGKTGAEGGVPAWQSAKYSIILTREDGNWKIRNVSAVEYISDD